MPSPKPLAIFFSAGEPSGDLHGANLIRQLRSRCAEIEVVGYGGPQMAGAGRPLPARLAKVHGIPVFYYAPPQIWAWAQWRVKKMRRLVDHVLCSLPFEEPWFRRHGCNATFVGHPFFDEVRRYPYDEQFIAEHRGRPAPLVA